MNITAEQLRLYAVTDRGLAGGDADALLRAVGEAIDGGAAVVQLREKGMPAPQLAAEAARFVALCRSKGAVSIINDDVDAALMAGADGVHLGQGDCAAALAREKLGPGKIIGVSAHNVAEALAAEAAGADYLGVGAAFGSKIKADAAPISRQVIREITAAVHIPVVAIGGINAGNITELAGCGLAGVAVVSALFGQADVRGAAERLLARSKQL